MNSRFRYIVLLAVLLTHGKLLAQNLSIYKSDTSVEETTRKVVSLINELNLIFFETVDHTLLAAEKGYTIPPTRSILFEDSDLTSKLITCQQTTALDLPMEILVWEENGDVYIGFIDPKFMKKRFMVIGCDEVLEEMSKIMIRISNDVLRQ